MPTRCSRRPIARRWPGICATRGSEQAPSAAPADEEVRRTRFADYARRVRQRVSRAQRVQLVERLWTVAFSDGAIGEHENRLMHLAGELLGIGPGSWRRCGSGCPGSARMTVADLNERDRSRLLARGVS